MKRATIVVIGLILTGLAGCSTPPDTSNREGLVVGAAQAYISALLDTQCFPLARGKKNIVVGSVCVANDSESLFIDYTTNGACLLMEVHVCAALASFPWTAPGQCQYKDEFHGSPASSHSVEIPLSSFPGAMCGESEIFIQAHAKLSCAQGQESAYGGSFKGKIVDMLDCFEEPEEEVACTLTQGYWKNHPEDWSQTTLDLGGAAYSHADAMAILQAPSEGDASLILAHQLIAAKLNILVGGVSDESIAAALGDADAWLAANADGDGSLPFGVSPDSAEASALASILDSFNNGLIGPGHCN